jgi:hypothetical protein
MNKILARFVLDKAHCIDDVCFSNTMTYIFNQNESIKSNDNTFYTLDEISSMCASNILTEPNDSIQINCVNKKCEDVIIVASTNTIEFWYLDDYNMRYEENYLISNRVVLDFENEVSVDKFNAALIIFDL